MPQFIQNYLPFESLNPGYSGDLRIFFIFKREIPCYSLILICGSRKTNITPLNHDLCKSCICLPSGGKLKVCVITEITIWRND